MRIAQEMIAQTGGLKAKTKTGGLPSSLNVGDKLDARVLSCDKNSVTLKTTDGQIVKARPEQGVTLAEGEQVTLEVTAKEDGVVFLSVNAKEQEGENTARAEYSAARGFEDKSLEPYARTLQELNIPVREGTARAMRGLMESYPDMKPEEAAFLASNGITEDSSLIKAALSLLSGEAKTSNIIGSMLKLLNAAPESGDTQAATPEPTGDTRTVTPELTGNTQTATPELTGDTRAVTLESTGNTQTTMPELSKNTRFAVSEPAGDIRTITPETAGTRAAQSEGGFIPRTTIGGEGVRTAASVFEVHNPSGITGYAPTAENPQTTLTGWIASIVEQGTQDAPDITGRTTMPHPEQVSALGENTPEQTRNNGSMGSIPHNDAILQNEISTFGEIKTDIPQKQGEIFPTTQGDHAEISTQSSQGTQTNAIRDGEKQPVTQTPQEQPTQPEQRAVRQEQPQQPTVRETPQEQPTQPEQRAVRQEQPQQPTVRETPQEQPTQPEQRAVRREQPQQPTVREMPQEQPTQPEQRAVRQEQPQQPTVREMPQEQPMQPEQRAVRQEQPQQPTVRETPQEQPTQPEQSAVRQEQPQQPTAREAPQEQPMQPEQRAVRQEQPQQPTAREAPQEQPTQPEQRAVRQEQPQQQSEQVSRTTSEFTNNSADRAVSKALAGVIAQLPEFKGTPERALVRFSEMLLGAARDGAVQSGDLSQKLSVMLDKMFCKVDKDDEKAGERLKQAKDELFMRLSMVEEAVSGGGHPAKPELLRQTQRLMDHVRLVNNIEQFVYMQLPVKLGQENKTADVYLYKRRRGGKNIDPEDVNILLSLDLDNIGHWESFVNIKGKDVSLRMEVRGEAEKECFSENTVKLHNLLAEAGFKLSGTSITHSMGETTPLTAMSALKRFKTGRAGSLDYTV